MTYSAVTDLCRKNIETMSLEQLQRHKVRLIDAWRDCTAYWGLLEAAMGFYKLVDDGINGFSPRNPYLKTNIEYCIEQTDKKLKEIYKELKIV